MLHMRLVLAQAVAANVGIQLWVLVLGKHKLEALFKYEDCLSSSVQTIRSVLQRFTAYYFGVSDCAARLPARSKFSSSFVLDPVSMLRFKCSFTCGLAGRHATCSPMTQRPCYVCSAIRNPPTATNARVGQCAVCSKAQHIVHSGSCDKRSSAMTRTWNGRLEFQLV